MHRSSGYLVYYPNGWLVLKCCEDLAKYYRRSLKLKALAAPPFGSHITIINGRVEQSNYTNWKVGSGKDVEFEYEHQVQGLGGYYWVRVHCEELHDIRESLGLSRELKWPLHLTVAKERSES